MSNSSMASSWSRYGIFVLCRGVSFPYFELWSSVRHNVSCPFERQYVKWMSCLGKIFSSISHLVFVMPFIAIMVLELLSLIEFVWENVSCTFERLAALEKFVVGWILLMSWEDLVGRGMKWMVRCEYEEYEWTKLKRSWKRQFCKRWRRGLSCVQATRPWRPFWSRSGKSILSSLTVTVWTQSSSVRIKVCASLVYPCTICVKSAKSSAWVSSHFKLISIWIHQAWLLRVSVHSKLPQVSLKCEHALCMECWALRCLVLFSHNVVVWMKCLFRLLWRL